METTLNKTVASLGALIALSSFTSGPVQAQLVAEYSQSPEDTIVKFQEHIGEIDDSLASPSLEIYGDGRMVVFFPDYMKKAGTYEHQLSEKELDDLIAELADADLPVFDSAQAKDRLEAAKARRQAITSTLTFVSDQTASEITLNLARFSSNASLKTPGPVNQRIVWRGIRPDAQHYPDVEPVQQLYRAHQTLIELMDHPQLKKVERK